MTSKSIYIHYKNYTTPLCELGKKYNTDKSPISDMAISLHRHPYTPFYHSLLREQRYENLDIAEIGIWHGGSLLMWREYFQNSNIFGFDYSMEYINNFLATQSNDRIQLSHIDVSNPASIVNSFRACDRMFDIILDDSSHLFDHEINIIENTYQFLKPGGVLMIEDIYPNYTDENFIARLQPILHHFQDYYFVKVDHNLRNSAHYDNDKILVLVKDGAPPKFVPHLF